MKIDRVTEARQCAELLYSDIIQCHKAACHDDPVLELVLTDLIRDSVAIRDRLAQLERCLEQ